MKPIDLPFVIVEWDDAWGDASESISKVDAHQKHKASVFRTHGYLLYENEAGVSITNEEDVDDETFRGRNFIPRALIRSITPCKITVQRPKSSRRARSRVPQADGTEHNLQDNNPSDKPK